MKRSIQHCIDSFLFAYRNMPRSAAGCTTAELIFKFKPITRHSLLKFNLASQYDKRQTKIQDAVNRHRGPGRLFHEG